MACVNYLKTEFMKQYNLVARHALSAALLKPENACFPRKPVAPTERRFQYPEVANCRYPFAFAQPTPVI